MISCGVIVLAEDWRCVVVVVEIGEDGSCMVVVEEMVW